MKNNKIILRDIGKSSFSDAWQYQEEIFKQTIDQKIKNRSSENKIDTNNFLIITEHNPVYTIGKSGNITNLLLNEVELKTQGIEFYKINRGGDITYHGPGQIMGYPIIDLDNFFTDINLYLRKLEEVIINTLQSYDLNGFTIKGETGVWVKDNNGLSKKVCAFGIRASRWVTMHGFSFNVKPELNYFKNIIPCGIKDKGVTSVSELKKSDIEMNEIKQVLYENFAKSFSAELVYEN
ncbi:MAG: lipoyl(octanoyl) transferase LipB [Cryomorphaceae bacterium]|jgi:lipoyl(octanoyl) transferase|nr:lipoyl(octanoyl) transferase LipB [Cryomorphaceae bacterium]MBT3502957.1 lipoyl(octanoyl) transferase LipB [Cryomorphaceae bacterium]MBT4221817.1 lipoyl(octanoyl) transferase LipB [Cryomorphaceae bacterium]MBT4293872.1 lipoyl(octanoyl) transferase LipB [Cryomorphaceae bacterium]MBT4517933.1 lipoyl(octanoyl) transferase LipB [Cryomorphaceae bacterium]